MTKPATITDVALAAGVSRQTVSNVLNSPDIVRPDTRERVSAAISRLAYRPHASARRLRTQKSSTIGIRLEPVVNGISGSVLDLFLHALTERATRQGLRVLLFTADDPDDEIEQFRRLLDGADVDAFVLTATFHGDPRTEWLIEHGHSFVTFGRPWGIDDMNDPQHLWVDVDGWRGLFEATRHAIAHSGPRVAYLGWPSPSGTGDDRRRGWHDAMVDAGLLTPREIDALHTDAVDGVSNGREATLALLARNPGLNAVVCASDSLALGALMVVPPTVAVTGYDNTPVAAALGLSSIEQPLDAVAAGVLELLAGPPAPSGAARTLASRARAREEAAASGPVDASGVTDASGLAAASGPVDAFGPGDTSRLVDAAAEASGTAPSTADSRHRLFAPRLVLRTPLEPLSRVSLL